MDSTSEEGGLPDADRSGRGTKETPPSLPGGQSLPQCPAHSPAGRRGVFPVSEVPLHYTMPAGKSTQGPSWGYLKVNFSETLSIFGDNCPGNGSNNGSTAPSTGLGYPHIGPFVGPEVGTLKVSWLNRLDLLWDDTKRAEDTQGTPTQSQTPPSIPQGYRAPEKTPPPRTLRYAYA